MNNSVRIFAIVFSVLLVTQTEAAVKDSVSSGSKILLGAKAGGNLYDNYQAGTKQFVSSPNFGFHAGIYGDYLFSVFNLNFAARVEALYSTRGLYLSEYNNSGTRIDYERQSSYVDFPVTVNYKVWKELSVHVGVIPSLFLEEYRSVTKTSDGFKVPEGDQFRSYERWQLGFGGGASYKFMILGQGIEVGARYSMATTRTNELIRGVRASQDPKYMMVQAYVAYKIFEF